MDRQLLDDLKKRHGYEEWRGSSTLKENLFIWRFFLSGNEFSGWQTHRIQSVESKGWPPSIQSIWYRAEGGTEELLGVDSFECASRVAAHDFLVRLLGEFQSPLVERQRKFEVGDIAFAHPGEAGVLFARANLVFLVRNAGRQLVPVGESARQLDKDLISKPTMEAVKVVPEIKRFDSAAAEFRVGVSAALDVTAADPLDRPLLYKFFSSTGEVVLEEGRVVYRPVSVGPQEVTVFAINANRGATSRQLRRDAR